MGAFKIVAIKYFCILGKKTKRMMTEDDFLKLAQKKYQKLQSLQGIDNFYDYEKSFDLIWQELGREVLESSLGEVSSDRRKKKNFNQIWEDKH